MRTRNAARLSVPWHVVDSFIAQRERAVRRSPEAVARVRAVRQQFVELEGVARSAAKAWAARQKRGRGLVTVAEMAEMMGVSVRTVRRQLPELELAGRVRPVVEGGGRYPSLYEPRDALPVLARAVGVTTPTLRRWRRAKGR